jgi:hypothetical protein
VTDHDGYINGCKPGKIHRKKNQLEPLLQGGATPCKNRGESVEAVRKIAKSVEPKNHLLQGAKTLSTFSAFSGSKNLKKSLSNTQ